MKTIKLFSLILLAALPLLSFKPNGPVRNNEPQYYVVSAWEYGNQPSKAQPVISNVVYARCDYHSATMVTNQFQTYYKAYFAKQRDQIGLERQNAFAFDTRDQAEAKRRELIASKQSQWTSLLPINFSILCED